MRQPLQLARGASFSAVQPSHAFEPSRRSRCSPPSPSFSSFPALLRTACLLPSEPRPSRSLPSVPSRESTPSPRRPLADPSTVTPSIAGHPLVTAVDSTAVAVTAPPFPPSPGPPSLSLPPRRRRQPCRSSKLHHTFLTQQLATVLVAPYAASHTLSDPLLSRSSPSPLPPRVISPAPSASPAHSNL